MDMYSVVEQPFKVPFVATIVRVANSENEMAGKAVIDNMAEALQRELCIGDFQRVKLRLRFFACLGDMCGKPGVSPILDALAEKLPSYEGDGNEVCSNRAWGGMREVADRLLGIAAGDSLRHLDHYPVCDCFDVEL